MLALLAGATALGPAQGAAGRERAPIPYPSMSASVSGDQRVGTPVTITISCPFGGTSSTPTLQRLVEGYGDGPTPVALTEVSPGIFETTGEQVDGGDTDYIGSCGYGTSTLIVDAFTPWMYPDPLISPSSKPLTSVHGLDCKTPTATVVFRAGEWETTVVVPTDPQGDWRVEPVPSTPEAPAVWMQAICGLTYVPVSYSYEPLGAAYRNQPVDWLVQPGGPPGSTAHGVVQCPSRPEVLAGEVGSDVFFQVAVQKDGLDWSFDHPVGDADVRFHATCRDTEHQDVVRFDVEHPVLRVARTYDPAAHDWVPTAAAGTDCPAGAAAAVTYTWGPEGEQTAHQTATLDPFGDWSAPLPDTPPGSVVVVDARCGDVHYPQQAYRAAGEAARPQTPAAPGAPSAPAARPVSGHATFTG